MIEGENRFDMRVVGNAQGRVDIATDNIHFYLVCGDNEHYPISCYGKPHLDETLDVWMWGYVYFCDKGERMPCPGPRPPARPPKVRLVAFVAIY